VELIDEFFTGQFDPATKRKDLAWFHRDGLEMTQHTWQDNSIRYLAACIEATHKQGLYLILNSDHQEHEFTLPNATWGDSFRCVFDSNARIAEFNPALKRPSDTTRVAAHSIQVWFVNRSAI
jgi:pullulanase/glycogen debranching enzyme